MINGDSSNTNYITQAQFASAVINNGYTSFVQPTYEQYLSFATQVRSVGGITTVREAAMFLTHVIWETGGLKFNTILICEKKQFFQNDDSN